ncbi:MAG: hypothetical protein NTX64_17245 [Elusimicrobia bacterium]|nr:hypothetical protein [Elusimicrobiota bacterium]
MEHRLRTLLMPALALHALLCCGTVCADDGAKDKEGLGRHVLLHGDMLGRVNPEEAAFVGGLNYRYVYGYSERHHAESAYWQTGLTAVVSPAYGRASGHLTWLPFIALSLRVQGDYYRFFGRERGLLSFNSPTDAFGEKATRDLRDEEVAHGQRLLFQPTLQGKVGALILRNQTDLAYYRFSGRGPYFLELEYYTLLKDGDHLVDNRTELLYEWWKELGGRTLLAGPYFVLTHAGAARITQQRIGGMLYWVPRASFLGLDRPRIQMKAGYCIRDPSFAEKLFFALGVGFDFDL